MSCGVWSVHCVSGRLCGWVQKMDAFEVLWTSGRIGGFHIICARHVTSFHSVIVLQPEAYSVSHASSLRWTQHCCSRKGKCSSTKCSPRSKIRAPPSTANQTNRRHIAECVTNRGMVKLVQFQRKDHTHLRHVAEWRYIHGSLNSCIQKES